MASLIFQILQNFSDLVKFIRLCFAGFELAKLADLIYLDSKLDQIPRAFYLNRIRS